MRIEQPGANADCLECSGSEERQMQLQPFCTEGNLLRMQPVAVHQRAKALAAQTKPARAGVRCRASAELHLTANAGRCDCGTAGRECGLLGVLWRLAVRHVAQMEPEGLVCGTWQKRAANAAADLLHESNRQRMLAVALLSESMTAQMEPAGRSAAPGNADRYGVGCSSRLTA